MHGVRGVRLVIVPQVSVRVRVLADRAVRAGRDDLARRAEREDAPVEHDQAVEPFVDAVEVMRRRQDGEAPAESRSTMLRSASSVAASTPVVGSSSSSSCGSCAIARATNARCC